jgi:hypothetical protein
MKRSYYALAGVFCLTSVGALGAIQAPAALNRVTGVVFQDLNGNGTNDFEPGLAGAFVSLDGSERAFRNITGSDGVFEFLGVVDGPHEVCVEPPGAVPPWTATSPSCVRFTLAGGKMGTSISLAFGFDQDGVEGCTRTQGYWGSSPAGQTLLATLVAAEPGSQMLLGSIGYSSTELQSILDSSVSTPGPGSNALINLAHQLIAAKANRLNGASAPQPVLNAIATADTLIGAKDMSPVGSSPQVDPASSEGASMLVQKTILDTYNNGEAEGGPSKCD